MVESWESKPLKDLVHACDGAREDGKYIFIWDQQGQVPTFMRYQQRLIELGPLVIKTALGQATPDDQLELIRANMVNAMRVGATLAISLDKTSVDFSQWANATSCPLSTVFNFKQFREHDTYFKVTKPEERHGLDGKVDGHFYMAEKFQLAIVTQGDAETVKNVWDNLPN